MSYLQPLILISLVFRGASQWIIGRKTTIFGKKVAKRFGEKKKVRIFAARFGKNRVIPEDNDTDKVIENTERLSTNEVPKQ